MCVVDLRLVADGAEALGAGLGAAACVLVCTTGEAGMCASVAGADAEPCRCAYLADACLARRADARFFVALVPELIGEVLAGDDAAPGAGPLLELPEPPQPATVSASAASSARAACERGWKIDMCFSGWFRGRHAGCV